MIRKHSLRCADGQATVELALVLPILVMVMLLVFQVALIGKDHLVAVHAAREGARAASVGDDATSVVHRFLPGASVGTQGGHAIGDPVRVDVGYVSRTSLPLVGPLLPDVRVRASVEMRTERPR
jgi:hypothetical protein